MTNLDSFMNNPRLASVLRTRRIFGRTGSASLNDLTDMISLRIGTLVPTMSSYFYSLEWDVPDGERTTVFSTLTETPNLAIAKPVVDDGSPNGICYSLNECRSKGRWPLRLVEVCAFVQRTELVNIPYSAVDGTFMLVSLIHHPKTDKLLNHLVKHISNKGLEESAHLNIVCDFNGKEIHEMLCGSHYRDIDVTASYIQLVNEAFGRFLSNWWTETINLFNEDGDDARLFLSQEKESRLFSDLSESVQTQEKAIAEYTRTCQTAAAVLKGKIDPWIFDIPSDVQDHDEVLADEMLAFIVGGDNE